MSKGQIIERFPVAATIDPTTLVTTETAYSDTVDMQKARKVAFTLLTGSANATSAVGIALQVSDESATDSTDWATTGVTGYTITGVTANEQAIVEIDASDLPSGKRYARALLTAAGDATGVDVAVVAQTADHYYEPADQIASATTYPEL